MLSAYVAVCFFKQGTTGNPKGATLSHHGILNNAFFVGEILNYDQVHTPLFTSHGSLLNCAMFIVTLQDIHSENN